jgi:putative addiction module component (TIGR02574 family)
MGSDPTDCGLVQRIEQRYYGFMERDATEVLREALALSPEVRAALIDSLIGSLDQEADAAAEESWREEINRRLHQIDSRAVDLIPWEEAHRRLRTRLER